MNKIDFNKIYFSEIIISFYKMIDIMLLCVCNCLKCSILHKKIFHCAFGIRVPTSPDFWLAIFLYRKCRFI